MDSGPWRLPADPLTRPHVGVAPCGSSLESDFDGWPLRGHPQQLDLRIPAHGSTFDGFRPGATQFEKLRGSRVEFGVHNLRWRIVDGLAKGGCAQKVILICGSEFRRRFLGGT